MIIDIPDNTFLINDINDSLSMACVRKGAILLGNVAVGPEIRQQWVINAAS
jgi:hypothetical protein